MLKEAIWSISIQRARDFFLRQEDMDQTGINEFAYNSCKITLTELQPNGVGMWAVKRIRIHMEGEDSDVETAYHRFFIQFLSAGG